MKDTVITAKAKRREIWLAAGCFLAANLVNIYAIAKFRTPFTELFTQIGYVLILAVAIYAVIWIVRLCVMLVRSLVRRRR